LPGGASGLLQFADVASSRVFACARPTSPARRSPMAPVRQGETETDVTTNAQAQDPQGGCPPHEVQRQWQADADASGQEPPAAEQVEARRWRIRRDVPGRAA